MRAIPKTGKQNWGNLPRGLLAHSRKMRSWPSLKGLEMKPLLDWFRALLGWKLKTSVIERTQELLMRSPPRPFIKQGWRTLVVVVPMGKYNNSLGWVEWGACLLERGEPKLLPGGLLGWALWLEKPLMGGSLEGQTRLRSLKRSAPAFSCCLLSLPLAYVVSGLRWYYVKFGVIYVVTSCFEKTLLIVVAKSIFSIWAVGVRIWNLQIRLYVCWLRYPLPCNSQFGWPTPSKFSNGVLKKKVSNLVCVLPC